MSAIELGMTGRLLACIWCGTPLTKLQIVRRNRYCSRSCAAEHYHAQHPDFHIKNGHRAAAANRARYIARLKQFLAGCTLGEAYRRGYYTGYQVGATSRRRREAQKRSSC